MSKKMVADRIPEEVLAEQWYGLMHQVIGKVQEAYREAAKNGLNQKIIAQRLGKKSPEVISRCLSGQKNMTLRTLHALTRAMDCRLDVSVTQLKEIRPSNRTAILGGQKQPDTTSPKLITPMSPDAVTGGSPFVSKPHTVSKKEKEYA